MGNLNKKTVFQWSPYLKGLSFCSPFPPEMFPWNAWSHHSNAPQIQERGEQKKILIDFSSKRSPYLAAHCLSFVNSSTIASQAELLRLKTLFYHCCNITFLSASAAHSASDLQSSCISYLNNLLERKQLTILLMQYWCKCKHRQIKSSVNG